MKLAGIRKENVTIEVSPQECLRSIAEELGYGRCLKLYPDRIGVIEERTKGGKLKRVRLEKDISYHGSPTYVSCGVIEDPDELKVWDALKTLSEAISKHDKSDN